MGSSVLFRGVNQVIKAYHAMDVPSWSMWAGKNQLLFSYSGDDMLEGENMLREAISMLKEGGTDASLILKVYQDVPNGKIKNNTPFDNSFGFSLYDLEEDSPAMRYRTQGYRNLEEKVEQLQQQLAGRAEEEEDEKPQGFMGKIGAILEKPEIQQMIIGAVAGYVKRFFNKEPIVASMGEIHQPAHAEQGSAWDSLSAEQRDKVQNAMDILMRTDPKIGDHLYALALIAQNEPSKYQMALKFL